MNQVGIHKNEIAFRSNKIPVIKEEKAFTLQNIENLVFCVEMFDTHIKLAVADHMFQGNAVNGCIISDFFQCVNLAFLLYLLTIHCLISI